MRDDVGDRLRLARSGRPFQYKVVAGARREHRGQLRRVRAARAENVLRMKLIIELRWLHVFRWIRKWKPGLMHQMPDHAVFGQRFEPVVQILPEKKFCE